jgi:preprotein translocase subunit SecD
MLKTATMLLASLAFAAGVSAAEPVGLSVDSARAILDTVTGAPVVEVRLSEGGQQTLAQFTRVYTGQRIDVLVGDQVVTSPVIQTPLDMAVIHISGLETLAIANDIANRLSGKKAKVFVRPSPK